MSIKAPEITCIIPAYENLALLSRCLVSTLTQESIVAEIIVCDDSNSSEVKNLVDFYSKQYQCLRYISGARSGNPVENWNRGIDNASSKYCVVIHHDEFLIDTRYLRKAVDSLDQLGLPAVIGRTSVVGINGFSWFALIQKLMLNIKAPLWTLYAFNWIGSTAVMVFNREIGVRFNANYVWIVDIDFYYRLLIQSHKIKFLKDISVVSIGHHDAQISASCEYRLLHLSELREMQKKYQKPAWIYCKALIIFARIRILVGGS